MLDQKDLASLVQEFYALVIERDDQVRLLGGAIPEERRQHLHSYYRDLAKDTREALARNRFDGVQVIEDLIVRRRGLTLTGEEHRQVQQAMLRGGIDLCETLSARFEGDFNYEPKDRLLKVVLADMTQMPASTPSPPRATPPPTANTKSQVSFTTTSAAFIAKRLSSGAWEKQSSLQAQKSYELFEQFSGDRPMASYTAKDARAFKEALEGLPAEYGKAVSYRGLTVREILDKAKAAKNIERLSPTTVKRHISAMSTLWQAEVEAGELTENIFAGFRFPRSKRANEQRDMWSKDELKQLVSTPIWAGCKSEGRRTEAGHKIIKDSKFWIPLIAVFSGMRQEEICQLQVEDIKTEDGVWVFDINSKPPRQLKNRNAVRRVPVHDALIAIGLLDKVETLRKRKEERLFPDLSAGGADDRLGHGFSKWFTRYRKAVGLYREGLDFHSFRHSATTFLQRASVPSEVIDALTGHATAGETARYSKGFEARQLKEAIDKIDLGFDLVGLATK